MNEEYEKAKAERERRANPTMTELLAQRSKLEKQRRLGFGNDSMWEAHWQANERAITREKDREQLAWEAWLACYLHAKGTTLKELGPAWTGTGGENELKEAFHKWYGERR